MRASAHEVLPDESTYKRPAPQHRTGGRPAKNDVKKGYTLRLVARNEGIEYRDQFDVYRFNVRLAGRKWTVLLPGSKGEHYVTHELSNEERDAICPRISQFLEGRKYFGFFGSSYPVIFEREGAVSPRVAETRRRAAAWWQKRKGNH
jgi:hypothetical protein